MKRSLRKKIAALLNLAFCFALHWLKKLLFWRKNGLEAFESHYRQEILPLDARDLKTLFEFSACLNCRLCDSACPALFSLPRERFPGPSFVLTTASRSFRNLWASSLDASLCQECTACANACPNGIDVKGAVAFVQRKVAEQIKFASGLGR